MDPYTPPEEESEPARPSAGQPGRPCPDCGSTNTGKSALAHRKPSILFVLLFGWFFLLVRGALTKRADFCADCGAVNRYKTSGSWVALAFLVLFILLIIAGILLPEEP